MDVADFVRAYDDQVQAIDVRLKGCGFLSGACRPVPYAQFKRWRAHVNAWHRFRSWLAPTRSRPLRWTQAMERGLVQRFGNVLAAWMAWVLAWQEGGELLYFPPVNTTPSPLRSV